jgi:hypothetical protein
VSHTLWATPYDPRERYPGDDFPNQDPRPLTGLPLWVQKDRWGGVLLLVSWCCCVAIAPDLTRFRIVSCRAMRPP